MVEVLARMNRISPGGLGAFKARLRKLQGEGVPFGANPGKGKRVDYTLPMIVEIAFAVELMQCGLSPTDAAKLVSPNRGHFYYSGLLAFAPGREAHEDPLVLISPASLSAYADSASGRPVNFKGAVSFLTRFALTELIAVRSTFEPETGDSWRWIIIDVRKAMLNVLAALTARVENSEKVRNAFVSEYDALKSEIAVFLKDRVNDIAEIDLEHIYDLNP